MNKQLTLKVEGVKLQYEFVQNKSIKRELISNLKFWKKNEKRVSYQALNDVSFDAYKGDTIGIIGRNGAGKSTLLRVIAGVFKPMEGNVEIYSQNVSLLALGTGFQAELSGVENIYLNGLLLGLNKKQIKERMREIIDFSELGEFINYPVRTYSSGMLSRLAFSTAIHIDPDILLIDEIIGVGDEEFKRKSSERIKNMIESDKTVVIVSHSMQFIKDMCNKVLWLEKGNVIKYGETEEVIKEYLDATRKK